MEWICKTIGVIVDHLFRHRKGGKSTKNTSKKTTKVSQKQKAGDNANQTMIGNVENMNNSNTNSK